MQWAGAYRAGTLFFGGVVARVEIFHSMPSELARKRYFPELILRNVI